MSRGFWRSELALAGKLLLAICTGFAPAALPAAGVVAAAAGCSVLKDPVYVAQQLGQYVTLFIETAQTVWSTIQPLLGSNAAADNAAFQDAVVTLQNANAAMISLAQAVAAGKVGDLQGAVAAVQKAVQDVMNVIAQFEQQTPAAHAAMGSRQDTLARMSSTIQHWGSP